MTDTVARGAASAAAWTPGKVVTAVAAFLLAGVLEIGGGWLLWAALRNLSVPLRPPLPRGVWVATGILALTPYGFVPLLQPASPSTAFGRIFAVCGRVFIGLSFGRGAAVDGLRLDAGDWLGGGLAIVGGLLAFFWPR
ncbi:hypothetical protein MMPV_000660 [Pyropia vietnamensis]